MYEVNLLSCSLGWTFPKKTDVEPEPQVALDLVNSMHSRPRILKISFSQDIIKEISTEM